MSRGHIDTATGGAFLSLTINGAIALINKMVMNQSWREERKSQKRDDCLKTWENVAFINNGFRQPGNNGWNDQQCPHYQGNLNYNSNSNYTLNQPSLKELLLGQAKINEKSHQKTCLSW